MLQRIAGACEQEPTVMSARLFQIYVKGEEYPPHPALTLRVRRELSEPDQRRLTKSINARAELQSWGYPIIDLFVRDAEDTLTPPDALVVFDRTR
jgi:hypothetical protein